MKALLPPLGELEKEIDRELIALADDRPLPITIDSRALCLADIDIEEFASRFARNYPKIGIEEVPIETTARDLVQSFLRQFGSEIIEKQGFDGFERQLIPALKMIIDRLFE